MARSMGWMYSIPQAFSHICWAVNTIPGFTEHSRYPGMMRAAGYDFAEVVDRIIGQAFEN